MSFGSRLKELRNAKGLTQEELAKKLGVTKGAVGNYETDASSPKEEILLKIFNVLNAEPNYLFQDSFEEKNTISCQKKANIVLDDAEQNIIKQYRNTDDFGRGTIQLTAKREYDRVKQQQEKRKNKIDKPIEKTCVITYDLPASAGTGAFLDGDSYEHIEYPADDVPYGTDFAVRIQGDSMEPDYHDGGIAFVRKDQINNGDIGIFVLNGEGYIKQLKRRQNNVYLVSSNPKYKPIKILESDSIFCVGKVLN